MTTNLFSTYRQGENRVTATFLAVLERLSLPNIDRILGALLEEDSFSLVSFENQLKGKDSTPDARIEMGRNIWIETKTSPNSVDLKQIKRHLKSVKDREKLLLLTPDGSRPSSLNKLDKACRDKVVWSNFINLAEAIGSILDTDDENEIENQPPSEREAFLLREFIAMLRRDRLLDTAENRVLVIAAREAWPVYAPLGAYITHPRSIRPSDHIAFYTDGVIQPLVPKIKLTVNSVELTKEGISLLDEDQRASAETRLNDLLMRIEKVGMYQGLTAKVLFLSGPDDNETVKLKAPVKHEGRAAFVQGKRYVTLESLKIATKTKELQRC